MSNMLTVGCVGLLKVTVDAARNLDTCCTDVKNEDFQKSKFC